MIRISHTQSRLIALALCITLFTSPVLAGGAGNGNGQGQGGNVQARVTALETQVATLTQDVQTLSQRLATTQSDVAALAASDSSQNQTLQMHTQQLATTQAQLTAAQTDLAAAQAQWQATQTQLAALATADSTLQAQLTALQTTVAGTQTQLDALNATAAATQSQLTALQAADSALQAQVDTLKATDASTQSDVTALRAQMTALQNQLDSYKATTASLAQLEELQTQMNALQEQINALDPAQYYKRDGSVALTGTLAGGGQDAANLRNISASGTVSANKISAVNITPELTVVENSACDATTQGSLAKDSSGSLLTCQAGAWKSLTSKVVAYATTPSLGPAVGGFQKISYATIGFGSMAGSDFMVPFTGFYKIESDGTGSCLNGAHLSVFVNGVNFANGTFGYPAGGLCSVPFNRIVFLSAGQIVDMRLYGNAGGIFYLSDVFISLLHQ